MLLRCEQVSLSVGAVFTRQWQPQRRIFSMFHFSRRPDERQRTCAKRGSDRITSRDQILSYFQTVDTALHDATRAPPRRRRDDKFEYFTIRNRTKPSGTIRNRPEPSGTILGRGTLGKGVRGDKTADRVRYQESHALPDEISETCFESKVYALPLSLAVDLTRNRNRRLAARRGNGSTHVARRFIYTLTTYLVDRASPSSTRPTSVPQAIHSIDRAS